MVAERQRPELAEGGTEPPCREGRKELALGTAWGPVFTPPRFPWVTGSVFLCLTSFHPSLSQTGGSQLPTQPGLPAGSSAGASSRHPAPPQRQHHGVGAAGSPPLLCGVILGTKPPGPSSPGLWPSSVPSVSSWGGARGWARLVSEDQQHHVASPPWVMGASQLCGETQGKCIDCSWGSFYSFLLDRRILSWRQELAFQMSKKGATRKQLKNCYK